MKEWLKENKSILILSTIFMYVCFGFYITHFTLNVDEGHFMFQSTIGNWHLKTGRWNTWLFDVLTQNTTFTPFFTEVLSLGIWFISGVVLAYIYSTVIVVEKYTLFFSLSFYASIPATMGEAFAFRFLILAESIAMLFVSIAVLLSTVKYETNRKLNIFLSIVLLIFAIGCYQAMLAVYLTAFIGYCLLKYQRDNSIRRDDVVGGIICTVIGFIGYEVINGIIGIVVEKSDYLSGCYMQWGNGKPVYYNLFMSLMNIIRYELGINTAATYIYGGVALRIVSTCFLFAVILAVYKAKDLKKSIVFLFSVFLLSVSPFVIHLGLGNSGTPGRTLIAFSSMYMVFIIFILSVVKNNKIRVVINTVLSVSLLINASQMNMMYFENWYVYEYDKEMTNTIVNEIEKTGIDYHDKALVIIGSCGVDDFEIRENGVLGASIFDYAGGSISEIIGFMKISGHKFSLPNKDQICKGIEKAKEMPYWPQDGSVACEDDIIVVNLSEPDDAWYTTNGVEHMKTE